MWWIIGNADRTDFVSWSCGQLDELKNAAVYRSKRNATSKIAQLQKNDPSYYAGLIPIEVEPVLK